MTTALYSGSFDPVHLGHVSVIRTASALFDDLVVVVLGNPSKPQRGLVPVEERVALLASAAADLPNVSCASWPGLTVDAAASHGATVIVRAAHKDYLDEITMAATNRAISGVGTGFLRADPATSWISSTAVRLLVDRGDIDRACELVPEAVAAWLRRRAA